LLSKKDFEEIPRTAVNEALSAIVKSVKQWVHFQAESFFAQCVIAAESCFQRETESRTTTELDE
jgi:hypothetical protein